MAEHAWIIEHLETYLAGGLTPEERGRLEAHVASCEACTGALNKARQLDRSLDELFTAVRPTPELEDRVIQALRTAKPRRLAGMPWLPPLCGGLAALVMIGALGSFMLNSVAQGNLPFFQASQTSGNRFAALNPLRQIGLAVGTPEDWAPVEAHVDRFVVDGTNNKQTGAGFDKGGLETDLADGRVAVAVRTSPQTADEGFVLPGSQVNVIQQANDGKARVLVENARVKAVASTGAGEATATLEVKPQDRLKLAEAQASGKLSLQLRPYSDTTRLETYGGDTDRKVLADLEKSEKRAGAVSAVPTQQQGKWALHEPALRVDGTSVGQPAAPSTDHYHLYRNEGMGAGKPVQPPAPGMAFGGAAGVAETKARSVNEKTSAGVERFRPTQLLFGATAVTDSADKKEAPQLPAAAVQAGTTVTKRDDRAEAQRSADDKGASKAPEPATPPPGRRIIRTGDVAFEIDSFDNATATITRLVGAIPGGFIATINSEKLPNGKVRGSVVVRVPPERLHGLLLDLRKELSKQGELKGQKIGSQDITKQYTDMESRLKAARAMEERLLQIIKTGKGEIKDLVIAEKELGVWRTKIEELEGELRYYANLVALSTLTITLTEKEIRAAVGLVEIERVQMGIEVEDVEKAQREALTAITEAKGTITKAELKQHSAGQFSALLHFSATPEKAGPLRDRLKQLGTVARFDVDRTQQTEGGTSEPVASATGAGPKLTRRDVQFIVSLYNLANVAPRETVQIQVAAVDAEAAYRSVLELVRKALGRVVTSDLNRQRHDQIKGIVHFEVKTAEAEAMLAALKEVGEVMSLQITENPDTQNVTRAKRGFQLQIWSLSSVTPRETATVQLATRDVPAAYRSLQQALAQAKGRVLNAQLNEQDRQNITAQLDFEVRRTEEAALETALAAQGDVYSRTASRAPESETTVDSKVRFQVRLVNAAGLSPRETATLAVEVRDVDQTAAAFGSYVSEAQGRVIQSHVERSRDGRITARLTYDVPLSAAAGLVDRFKAAGIVRTVQLQRNTQVPDSKLAVGRLDVTLSNSELIVPTEEGFWPQIRTGLKASFLAIAWSMTVVIIGVCVLLPWAVVIYGGYALVTRLRRRATTV